MPTTQFPRIPGPPNKADLQSLIQYVGQLANILAVLSKELDYLLNGSLDANNIRANSITTDLLQAGSVTADKISVNELSAINANLGHITAGLVEAIKIYGSLIATAPAGTYPRIEFSSANNLVLAEGNEDESIIINPSVDGTPQLFFQDTSTADLVSFLLALSIFIIITTAGTDITIAAGNNLNLQAGSGFSVNVQDWDKFYSTGDSQTLQQALDSLLADIGTLNTSVTALTSALDAKATAGSSTGSAGPFNGGIPIGTQLATTSDGTTVSGSVTWAGITSHSHTQT